ncbi:MAG: hypothetical protein E4H28_05080 [Gemmatimonadales bacterium]|nr:MAG: hypothetical protein E4H28_05080 [Gemmatimonadales bacterium]
MNSKWIVLVTVASLAQAPGVMAQRSGLAFDSSVVASIQQMPGEKNSALAGTLSALSLGLGLGSFYAGNSGHGLTHLTVAVASFGGILAGNSSCEIVFAGPDSDCTLVALSAVVFTGNWIWSIFTGVNDANDYNRSLYTAGLHLEPQLVAVRANGQNAIGLQLLRFGL